MLFTSTVITRLLPCFIQQPSGSSLSSARVDTIYLRERINGSLSNIAPSSHSFHRPVRNPRSTRSERRPGRRKLLPWFTKVYISLGRKTGFS